MQKIMEVWNYLTHQCGHQNLWIKENPVPPGQNNSGYPFQPVILSASGRVLAVFNLNREGWNYTAITPYCQPADNIMNKPASAQALTYDQAFNYQIEGY